ncbi:MAG: hypothetical protein M1826_001318 [Phylliscum demangeonii]|nr:MAG: hypothetical protein M1826_001318 [Phylliscum demangeonii]
MPAINGANAPDPDWISAGWHAVLQAAQGDVVESDALVKRFVFPTDNRTPAAIVAALRDDPWTQSGKYALGWVYFCVILLALAVALRFFRIWTDKIRTALYEEDVAASASASASSSPDDYHEMKSLDTNNTVAKLFPRAARPAERPKMESSLSSIRPLNVAIAVVRSVLYRPIPAVRWRKRQIVFPSIGTFAFVFAALTFVSLYTFVPQPLYYSSIRYGSPPVAIRAGMIAVAMVPWIVAMSMKANVVSLLTGIGHERLNVLHRWGGYLCLFLGLVHAVPFYVQPMWERGAMEVFRSYFSAGTVVYGSGIAVLVPLLWLCVASLPVFRRWMYELFVALHVPVAVVFLGMLFWHCHHYLTSWRYLWATVAIWASSYLFRLLKLNWVQPWRRSWLVGDEAAITLLHDHAIRITIPTQVQWQPGQYVYLRIPEISVLENHPFTIASLCSDDFPSEYGPGYQDMALVFKPFGGFTRKVLERRVRKGPTDRCRVWLDGPYGGMQRHLSAFDNVVLVAGGSGITALVSHVLDLVKRMRDGKAVTRKIQIVWAVKRLEAMDWFKEELRICREHAPLDAVECQFFVTASKRQAAEAAGDRRSFLRPRPVSGLFGSEKMHELAQGFASKRSSAVIRDDAGGDAVREAELRRENEDGIAALPTRPPPAVHAVHARRQKLSLDLSHVSHASASPPPPLPPAVPSSGPPLSQFDFGFPSTPTLLQKNLMRFAFGVSPACLKAAPGGWSVQYGRPDIGYMLKQFAADFGPRSCVFVCGPPAMRIDVARAVAGLQHLVFRGEGGRDEIYLHYEDFAF